MKKVHNFNAGPCVLPDQAIENSIEALKDFAGTGMAVIEVSHRSKEWSAVMDECRALWKELLNIPDTHEVVFLGGGASLQFLYVAMNFLENKAGYLETGVWAKKAYKEAKGLGNAFAVASSADKNFSYIPKGYEIPTGIDYFHITTNNTIYGTEIRYDMDSPVPLVADMSSDIMSRPVDVILPESLSPSYARTHSEKSADTYLPCLTIKSISTEARCTTPLLYSLFS